MISILVMILIDGDFVGAIKHRVMLAPSINVPPNRQIVTGSHTRTIPLPQPSTIEVHHSSPIAKSLLISRLVSPPCITSRMPPTPMKSSRTPPPVGVADMMSLGQQLYSSLNRSVSEHYICVFESLRPKTIGLP